MKSRKKPDSLELRRPASQYDKIFKENIEAVIPSLIANLLHIQAVDSEELPDDIQHTKERKPDVLKKITDSAGETFVLQLEFQVADEPEMAYRMADYYLMLRRKYRLPVRQYVLFVGPDRPKMLLELSDNWLTFRFPLVIFSDVDYRLFLRSEKPEEILLAILGDFKGQLAETVVQQVVDRIEETTQGDFTLKRYFQQLRVLAQLRNLQSQTDKIMDSLAEYVSEERDILYIRGQRKAKESAIRKALEGGRLTVEEIADYNGVSTEVVLEIQRQLA